MAIAVAACSGPMVLSMFAMTRARLSVASGFGNPANLPASSHASFPSRANTETRRRSCHSLLCRQQRREIRSVQSAVRQKHRSWAYQIPEMKPERQRIYRVSYWSIQPLNGLRRDGADIAPNLLVFPSPGNAKRRIAAGFNGELLHSRTPQVDICQDRARSRSVAACCSSGTSTCT